MSEVNLIHKTRLFYLRNRITLGFTVLSFVMLTMLFMQIMLVSATLKQSQRNEEILKGLSCILLIMPEDRNVGNVKECVIKNRSIGDGDFEFNPASYVTPIDKPQVNLAQPVDRPINPSSPTSHITAKSNTPMSSMPPDPKPKAEGSPPTPETHPNPSGKKESRYDDDTLWHLLTGGK